MDIARVWSVSQLNQYVRSALESDPRLQDLWVAGEISNFSRPASGHWYFTLKDEKAQVRCVLWRSQAARQTYTPRDGDGVEAHGRVGVYEAGGQYQMVVDYLTPVGVGDLAAQFDALKRKLAAAGLFAQERKRPLPARPRRIGLVTSPTAAALRDLLNVIRRRWPLAEVILSPTAVQGEEAAPQIVAAIQALDRLPDLDVMIVARGGGSLEDLWAFNDERVAYAIYHARTPVVSGVGHEIDFTIADFVADVRAPTPSAAAEITTPDRAELRQEAGRLARRLAQALAETARRRRWALAERAASLRAHSPRAQLANARQRLDDLLARAHTATLNRLTLRREKFNGLAQALAAISPLATLARGYAIVTRAGTSIVIRSPMEVNPGDRLDVRVHDGSFGARVE